MISKVITKNLINNQIINLFNKHFEWFERNGTYCSDNMIELRIMLNILIKFNKKLSKLDVEFNNDYFKTLCEYVEYKLAEVLLFQANLCKVEITDIVMNNLFPHERKLRELYLINNEIYDRE